MASRHPLPTRPLPDPRSSLDRPSSLEGIDETAWLDVIQKMEQVYTQLIDDEVKLEHKNAELELQQQFIASVMASMSDVLVVCDRSGRIEQVNRALCELVGGCEAELIGQPVACLLADEASQERAQWAMQSSAGQGVVIELNLLDRHGQPLSVDASCTPRLGGARRRLGTVWVGRQTGELKRAYQELQAAHAALKRTQQQLLHSEKMASLGQLVAGVAHELNNPISFVLGNTHALQKYGSRLQSYLGAVHGQRPEAELRALRQQLRIDHLLSDLPDLMAGTLEGAQRTADIVQGLKRFSAMDRQERQPLELAGVIERAIEWVQKGQPEPVPLRWQRPDTALPVQGSAGQLQQVLMNLLQNACYAVATQPPARRWVEISAVADASQVRVTVLDGGAGIAPEHLSRIFDPFFTTKPVGQGTGLGLSISYGIVEEHGGQLSGRNSAHAGAEFELSLPRVDAP
ncbi:sensor histidine kinase [Serpentinimonas barnesii]|uniref:sensor histidine kinase n=1 Tax=Serpentinimonas barnesii TaxID=1458427 RepID=UPI0005F048C2|nr:ATP-binding protein [Serpentinimonas barnesii]